MEAALRLAAELAELTVKINDRDCAQSIASGRLYVPAWLGAAMGQRERSVVDHPQVRTEYRDQDGERLGPYQQRIVAPIGSFIIDSLKRRIIG